MSTTTGATFPAATEPRFSTTDRWVIGHADGELVTAPEKDGEEARRKAKEFRERKAGVQ